MNYYEGAVVHLCVVSKYADIAAVNLWWRFCADKNAELYRMSEIQFNLCYSLQSNQKCAVTAD